jgi:hypothetical protein
MGLRRDPRRRTDLLYALGWALWTGVVLVIFVEISAIRRPKAVSTSRPSMPTRRRWPVRPEPESGQAPDHHQDWQAAIAETAADIRDLDPLADDKLAALRAKLKDYQGRPVAEASTEAVDTGASEA